MNSDDFKLKYEEIVFAYNRKLLFYAKTLCDNNDHAKEIVQETFMTGFQYFGSLNDKQKVFPWLKTIAKRIYLRKFHRNADYDFIVSIDAPIFDDGDVSIADTIIADTVTIEDSFIQNELCRHILNEIDNLSQKQRDSVIFRYFYGLSVKETAASLKMTDNSVKVSSHIGLEKVKERLKNYFIKGDYIMNCKEAYAYLHQYAKGKISEYEKMEVETHINICKECRDIALSLIELEKHIIPAQEKEHRNYTINIQLNDYLLEYVSVCMELENYREVNEKIEEWGEEVPFDALNLNIPKLRLKFSQTEYLTRETLARFGDGGFRWHIEEYDRNEAAIQYRYTKINKVCNPHELSFVFLLKENLLKPSIEHPDLIHGYAQNWHSQQGSGKVGVYIAVPSNSKNLRIKQGDGIIDCGAYKFVYADRHVLKDEHVNVSCSYIN